jgi:transposase
MNPEKLFHEMLGLGSDWSVSELHYLKNKQSEVRIVIESQDSLESSMTCPVDGSSFSRYDLAPKRTWRHLNIFQHECYIECRLPRMKCNSCGKISTVKAPWEGKIKGFTLLFEAFALTLMREMPVNAAAKILGEYDTRLWRLLHAYVQEAYSAADFSEVRVVGCDELSARKGHNYVSVFADLKAKQVIYATPGKDATTWDRLAEELPKHSARAGQIETVSIDMSPAYKKGVKENCPDASVVFDRFHVMKNVGDAVDEVRRREHSNLVRKGKDTLKESMWLFSKNPENLDDEQTASLNEITKANLFTAKAYQMRLTLRDIYEINDETVFKRKLLAWSRWVKIYAQKKRYIFAPMVTAANTIMNHLDGIISFARDRITNAFMEGLNSVFSAVKRKARGFRSTDNLITMLYFVSGKLKFPILD